MKERLLKKIYGEYQAFRTAVLSLPKEEIFGRCYEIDAVINIYEIIMQKAEGLPDKILAALLPHKDILLEFYALWLEKDDSAYLELESHVMEELDKISAAERTEREDEV